MKSLQSAFILFCLLGVFKSSFSQKHRYNFAQSYLGIQADYLHNFQPGSAPFGAARMVIGGTHFWYRADFYISFPLATRPLQTTDWKFSEGVITGARYLPLGPGKNWPHPFVGAMWMTPSLQVGGGPEMQRNRLGVEAGLSWVVRKKHTFELHIQRMTNARWTYPVSREVHSDLSLPYWNISVGFKKYFDITAGNATPQGQAWLAAAQRTFEEYRVLSGWSIAAGLTANVPLQHYSFADNTAYFPNVPSTALATDFAVGYYWHATDLGARVSYRPVTISQQAYGHHWRLTEQRLTAEAFKFLFDYKGFVPFAGIAAGVLHQSFRETDHGNSIHQQSGWSPAAGIVVGWDIRPSPVDWFLLRTNLRLVFPTGMKTATHPLRASHLEVNFIQFVLYPQRLFTLKHIPS